MSNKTVSTNERIPLIPLSYTERELAIKKELLLDYENYKIYVVDSEDKTIIHDLTEILVSEYLTNIDGDNVWVTIEGIDGKVNLSQILSELNKYKLEIVNTLQSETITPSSIRFDHSSVTVEDNLISLYGFKDASPLSTPRKSVDGTLEWISATTEGEDITPKSNVIYIYPMDNTISLFAKPNQYTIIPASLYDTDLELSMDFSNEEHYLIHYRLDCSKAGTLTIADNSEVHWVNGDSNALEILEADHSYYITFETWDYGNTWIGSYTSYNNSNVPDPAYLEENGYIVEDEYSEVKFYDPPTP